METSKSKSSGRTSVGHPVDPAGGTLYQELEDHALPGRVPLVFGRRYSTGLGGEGGLFGPGWSSPFEVYLRRTADGYTMVAEDGELQVRFTDWHGRLELGDTLSDPGNYSELRREGKRYIVRRWSPEPAEVVELIFEEGFEGARWPLLSKQDLAGQGFEIERDENGRITFVRQRREGRGYRLVHDGEGRVVEVHLKGGQEQFDERLVMSYGYDREGRLAEVIDALGQRTTYAYDEAGRLARERTAAGMEYRFEYDAEGRCILSTGTGDFGRVELEYDELGQRTRVKDALGQITLYDFNEFGQVVTQISPLGHARFSELDPQGRLVAEKSAQGRETRYRFDERGDRVEVVGPGGETTRFAYNELHQLVAVTDPSGQVWRREHDPWGRIAAVVNPLGERMSYHYDNRGDLVDIEDPLGAHCGLEWNAAGDLVGSSDFEGHWTRYERDREGQLLAVVDPLGHRVEAKSDLLGRLRELRLPDGAVRRLTWDANDQVTELVDELEGAAHWRYESCGQLKEMVRPDGSRVRFDWSAIPGQLIGAVNARGERYELRYDADGHLALERDFSGRVIRYENDLDGLPLAIQMGDHRIDLKRDPAGRVVEQRSSDGSASTVGYDPCGRLVRAQNGVLVEWSYDAAGRLTCEVQGGHRIESSFDAAGARVSRRSSMGGETRFRWDANGLLGSLSWADGGRQQSVTFDRDARGDELVRQVADGVHIEQLLDRRGWRNEQRVRRAGAAPLLERHYRHDLAGNLQTIADSQWGKSSFAYDSLGRMLSAELPGQLAEQLAHDPADNITRLLRSEGGSPPRERACSYAAGNVLERCGEEQYRHDDRGRLIERTGRGGEKTRYRWNDFGQLTAVTLPDFTEWKYLYDALGRRVRKEGPAEVVELVWDGDVILHEVHRPKAERVPPAPPAPARVIDWEFEPGGFAPIGKREEGRFYLCANDPAGNPRELLGAGGEVVWRGLYSALGSLAVEERPGGISCPVRLQGQWHDEETGLHYNWHRYYDPSVGRFVSPDPIGVVGGLNLYRFAPNTTGWSDPYGLAPHICFTGRKISTSRIIFRLLLRFNWTSWKTAFKLMFGLVRINWLPTDPHGQPGVYGRAAWSTDPDPRVIQLYLDAVPSNKAGAGMAAHEATHIGQGLTPSNYRQSHEVEAYKAQRKADPDFNLTDDQINAHVASNYPTVPP